MISYEEFFTNRLYNKSIFWKLQRIIKKSSISGTVLRISLSFELIPMGLSAFLKAGGYRFFRLFFNPYIYEGVCVSFRSRMFGSSITLRIIDEGVMFDRTFLLFSPLLINIRIVSLVNFVYSESRPKKAKFFFLKSHSQKKLISKLFN